MELLLNLLWFVLAAGTLVTYLHSSQMGRKHFLLGLGSLLCILVLLLPAISITDDLHFEAVAVEDSNATKWLVNAAFHACHFTPLVGLIMALQFPTAGSEKCLHSNDSFQSVIDSCFRPFILGRAPPYVLV